MTRVNSDSTLNWVYVILSLAEIDIALSMLIRIENWNTK